MQISITLLVGLFKTNQNSYFAIVSLRNVNSTKLTYFKQCPVLSVHCFAPYFDTCIWRETKKATFLRVAIIKYIFMVPLYSTVLLPI